MADTNERDTVCITDMIEILKEQLAEHGDLALQSRDETGSFVMVERRDVYAFNDELMIDA